jgi:hypothetical protein
MKRLLACLIGIALWLGLAPMASAQIFAQVVASCGSVSYTVGTSNYITVDTSGHLCVSTTTGGITLGTLTLSPLTATAGSLYTGSIATKTAGSTITASSSDGTSLTVSGSTLTGTFTTAGTPTINLTETLAGASNSPHTTVINTFTVNSAGTDPSTFFFPYGTNAAHLVLSL